MAPVLVKSLSRLSRSSIIDLALKWLQQNPQCQPYLACNRSINESEEEDYLFTPAEDVDELQEIYQSLLQDERDASKAHVVDRIVDGDWRRGLSLHQLAMVDMAYLEQNDTALRWSALKLTPLEHDALPSNDTDGPSRKKQRISHQQQAEYPSISPSAFVAALKSEISPLVKAHYHLHRLPAPYNLPILRLYISPKGAFAPRNSSIPRPPRHAVDSGRIMYIAIPDSCPYVYISLSGSSARTRGASSKNGRAQLKVDMASMKRIILEAIPKAMSRPHERWSLETTKLNTKSLRSICSLRGNGRPGTSGGTYSRFGSDQNATTDSPVDVQTIQPTPLAETNPSPRTETLTRFGSLSGSHHAPLDRFHVHITDVLRPPDLARSAVEAAPLTINFSGSDVFLGLKKLAESGSEFVDMKKVPSWLTGEMGVSNYKI